MAVKLHRPGWSTSSAVGTLGIDDEKPENAKGRYKFPYGDFKSAHRCALLAAESRARRFKCLDIENAAHRLHLRIAEMAGPRPTRQRSALA
jgi:hypothetical protein